MPNKGLIMRRAFLLSGIIWLLFCAMPADLYAGCYCSGGIGYWCKGPGNTNCLPNSSCNWACSAWSDVGHIINQQFINNNFNTWQQTGEGKPGHPPGYEQYYGVGPIGDREGQAINDYFDTIATYSNTIPKNDPLRMLENMIANNLWDEKHINEFLKLLEIPEKHFNIFYEKRDEKINEFLEKGYSKSFAELEANKEAAQWIVGFIPSYLNEIEGDTHRMLEESGITKKLDSKQPTPYVPLNKSVLCPFISPGSNSISIPLVIR